MSGTWIFPTAVTVPCGKGGKQRNAKFNGIARSALMRLLAERGGSL
jgi:hypothetical protein